MKNDITIIGIDLARPRKARATKHGKVHYAYGNMSLCLQYVGDDEVVDKEVDCKRCIKKFDNMR
ncbi:hypothetical protein ACR77J_07095 [Tissierella praeacuta]|uniref:hypothetical protein n=1 Tax=Tissierella praeacuta TaxID=43131 RepID=UPI003DA4F93A